MKQKARSRIKKLSLEKRLQAPVVLLTTIELCIFLWAFGQFSEYKKVLSQIEVKAYEKPIVIEKQVVREVKIAKVTAYSCGGLQTDAEIDMNCPSLRNHPNGRTATGTTPRPNVTVACDKANLGKTFELKGIGQVKCEDTGSAIKGAGRFDLYVETVEEAYAFGTQYIEYFEIKN